MSFSDETLVCRECGRQFVFTAGEQEFYASRGLLNKPGRCPECRAARKSMRPESAMTSRSSYGDGGYSDRSMGSSRGGGSRQMYSATCSNCGKEALVPFQPTLGKPVYCSDCYSQVRSARY